MEPNIIIISAEYFLTVILFQASIIVNIERWSYRYSLRL